MQISVCKEAIKNQNIFVSLTLSPGHCNEDTAGSLHSYHITLGGGESDQQSQEEQQQQKRRECLFFFNQKRRKSESCLLHWRQKSWIPSQNNYPRLPFPFSTHRNLNISPYFSHHGRIKGFTLNLSKKKKKKPQNLLPSLSSQVHRKVFKSCAKYQSAHEQAKERIWQQNRACK